MKRRFAQWICAMALLPGAAWAACPATSNSEALFTAAHQMRDAGELEEAITCQQRGLVLAGDTLRAAEERFYLGELFESAGKVAEALASLQQALPQMQRHSGPSTELTADLLRRLGWVQYRNALLPEAEATLQRAHAIYLQVLPPRHIKVAKVLNNLGVVVRDRGQYEAAESILKDGLEVATRGLTPDDDMRAVIYNNIAGLWYYRGDYRRALENYRAALPIFERLYGDANVDVGMTLNNLGAVSEELGDYANARIYYARALATQEKLVGLTHPTIGAPLVNTAVMAHALGDVATAEVLFQRALVIYEKSMGSDHPLVGETLVKYASLKRSLGQNQVARGQLERSLRIHEKTYGPDSNWIAASLNELGPVLMALGQGERAREALVKSIAVSAAAGEPQTLMIAYANYAAVLAEGGELPSAVFYGKLAVNLAQQARADLGSLGQAVQKSFLAKRLHYYRDLADRLIALGRLAEAEQVLTMLKEEEYFDFVRIVLRGVDTGPTRADFSALERPRADEFKRLMGRLVASAGVFRAARNDAAKARSRVVLTGDQDRLRQYMVETTRALRRTPARATSTAFQPAAAVAPGVARVRFLVTTQRVRAIVVTQKETIATQVAVDVQKLNRLVFELRQAVQDSKSDPLPAAQSLHRLLVAPLQAVLDRNQVNALELELDGTLRYVPFSALHDGKSWLLERFSVAQRTLATTQAAAQNAPASRQLAGFGVSKAVGGLPALPSAAAELDRIVRLGPEDRDGVVPGILLMDEAFTEASLRSALQRNYSLVHVASHFVFRPGPLSDSYLLLGNGQPLTLERLRDNQLSFAKVQLLTLSACSTAMGEAAENGGELESFGVLAQRMGAREVLASLWPVADRSTSNLMLAVYRSLTESKLPTAQALQRAQLGLLRGDPRFAPYAHPFYWAPFIVMRSGDQQTEQ
jgi:CHAT domain-containing protein